MVKAFFPDESGTWFELSRWARDRPADSPTHLSVEHADISCVSNDTLSPAAYRGTPPERIIAHIFRTLQSGVCFKPHATISFYPDDSPRRFPPMHCTIRVLALVALILPTAGAIPAFAAPPTDACSLLTAAQVSSALGSTVGQGTY